MAILEGIKVLDFSQGLNGSLATMILADNGAQITKIEPPGGDPYRGEPAWIMWSRGKRSVVLDLNTTQGQEQARRLALLADVVLENFVSGTADRLGIGHAALSAANPRLVYCSITGIGSKGKYAHLKPYDGIISSRAGDFRGAAMAAGPTDRPPTYRARPNASWASANHAIQGIMGALRVRLKTGLGQRVETSMYQGIQTYDIGGGLPRQQELGMMEKDATPMNPRMQGPGAEINIPYLVVRCKDGQWLQMACMANRLIPNWMKVIGLAHIYEDERFKGIPNSFKSSEDKAELRRMILEKMQEKTQEEWLALFGSDVGGDAIITTQQAMDHPQMLINEAVIDLDDPAVGPTRQLGPLVMFTDTPAEIRSPAPRLGQHTEEAIGEAATANTNGAKPAATQDIPKHPFAGMTVLDFSTWLAAPVGTALIADLGARVIKVESPAGDEFRPFSSGRGRTFQGKESLVLDLKTKEAQQVIYKLVPRVDAIMHNMRGDAPNRLGIDYEAIRKINPNIVYLYAGSYGSAGPGAGRPAFHPTAGALSGGVMWQLGTGNEPPPNDTPMTIDEITQMSVRLLAANEGSPDVTSAIGVGTALALALYEKERTGKGQYLETRMVTSNAYICSDDFIRYQGKPNRIPAERNQKGTHALNRMYSTKEGWLFIACPLQEEWEALCNALGKQEWLADGSLRTREGRIAHDARIVAALGLIMKERTANEWEEFLGSRGVPVARADATRADDFLLTDEAVKENGFIARDQQPMMPAHFRAGPPVHFSITPARAENARAFGANTEAILKEIGMSQSEIEALKQAKIAVTPDMVRA